MNSTTRAWVLFATLCVFFSAGCGSGKLGVVPVSGTLTIDGQPADNVEITLVPVDTSLPSATGLAQGGKFELFSGVQGASGAVPGTYKLVLAVRKMTTEEETRAKYAAGAKAGGASGGSPVPQTTEAALPFATKYTSSSTTDKEVTIPPKGGSIEIDVSSK